jgi:hypothetical protein
MSCCIGRDEFDATRGRRPIHVKLNGSLTMRFLPRHFEFSSMMSALKAPGFIRERGAVCPSHPRGFSGQDDGGGDGEFRRLLATKFHSLWRRLFPKEARRVAIKCQPNIFGDSPTSCVGLNPVLRERLSRSRLLPVAAPVPQLKNRRKAFSGKLSSLAAPPMSPLPLIECGAE